MVEMKYPETKFNLESPGGLVNVRAQCKENQVENVILESMPSFVGWSNRKVWHQLEFLAGKFKKLVLIKISDFCGFFERLYYR